MASLLLLVGGVFLFVVVPGSGDQESSTTAIPLGADGAIVNPSDFLVRPIISDFGETGLSFDGGKYLIFDYKLPRVAFGEAKEDRRLQIVMLTDWTDPECRRIYQLLNALYTGGDGKNLPGIEVYALPLYRSEQGKSVHEAVLAVHFGSNQVDTLPEILAELSAGTLSADPNAVQKRVAEIDPDLATRWESLSLSLKDRFSDAFRVADAQHRYNKSKLNDHSIPQLLVFDSVLAARPTTESLAQFLRSSAVRQHSFLTSPGGATPLVIDRSCNCSDLDHDHSLMKQIQKNP